MICRRLLALLCAVALAAPAATVSAEMTFEPDDVEEDEPADDGDEMTFAPDDLEEDDFDPDEEMEEQMDVGVVAIPGDDISADDRDDIQDALREAADRIPDITTFGDADLLPQLQERGPQYCSRESLCLGSVGDSAGFERILQARVEEDDRGFRLDIDYFDVDDRLFVAYHSNSGLGGVDDIVDAIPAGVDDIFDIRRDDGDDPFVDDRDVDVQGVMAYSTAGGAVASLATGIFFGARASGQESDIESARNEDGEFTDMTQTEVRDMRRSMESNASTANIFYGMSAGLAATSILLFVLRDDDSEAQAGREDSSRYGDVEITPRVGSDGFGVGASFEF